MNATGGLLTVGGFALILGLWLYWHRDMPRFTVFLFLLGGMVIGGVFGSLLGGLLSTGIDALGTTTGRLIGVSTTTLMSAVGLVLTLEVLVHGMGIRRRGGAGRGGGGGRGGGATKRWHPWLALALPTVVIATGVPLIAGLFSAIGQAAGSLPLAQLGG